MTLYKRIIRTALLIAAVTMLAGTVTAAAVGGAEGSGQTKVILGDANCDGEITIVDATSIQRYLVDLPVNGGFSEKAADVDGSGFLDITDATKIQRWRAGYYTPFPIGRRSPPNRRLSPPSRLFSLRPTRKAGDTRFSDRK